MPNRARILLIDDHPILRQGMITLIDAQPDLKVCGEADDIPGALEAVERLKPDFAIVDISLKGRNGIELLKDLRARHPGLPLMVLSMYDELLYAERALRAGAKGYVMKQEAMNQLLTAIRRILAGEIYVSPRLSSLMVKRLLKAAAGHSPLADLTDREMEVFERIGRGQGTSQIAQELNLSVKTIETHREHVKAKLGLHSGAELLRYAIERSMELEGAGPTPGDPAPNSANPS